MIVRILGERQLELAETDLAALNEVDEKISAAVEAGDEEEYRLALERLLDMVRTLGTPLPADFLGPSDLVVPGSDTSLADVQALLGEDGLIPG